MRLVKAGCLLYAHSGISMLYAHGGVSGWGWDADPVAILCDAHRTSSLEGVWPFEALSLRGTEGLRDDRLARCRAGDDQRDAAEVAGDERGLHPHPGGHRIDVVGVRRPGRRPRLEEG